MPRRVLELGSALLGLEQKLEQELEQEQEQEQEQNLMLA